LNISLRQVGKRFNRDWIFKDLNYNFIQGEQYAITGINGSGKSTLLQVIAGATLHSAGSIAYANGSNAIGAEAAYKNISIAAPYLDLIEEFTATELLTFHSQFKKLTTSLPNILQAVGLQAAANKQIRLFSSGMKQRLKLAQAFFSDGSVLLLDEPTSNLDADGIAIYQHLIQTQISNRLVVIASNDANEYHFCKHIIDINSPKS
jgi:ABC-type multidrug transport system ATPase subunit